MRKRLSIPRLMLAAPASGTGKTTLTCGLLSLLQASGKRPAAFKCGPDYIDPMFHRRVIGVPSKNLDAFFTPPDTVRELLAEGAENCNVALLEGVMGLYDGLGGVTEQASSYALAELTGTPIVLVVDARGVGNSLLALLDGFLAHDKSRLLRGVIFNRAKKSVYTLLAPLIEEKTGLRVFGYAPQYDGMRLESRHLGLVQPSELADIRERIAGFGQTLRETLDIDGLLALSGEAAELSFTPAALARLRVTGKGGAPRIGVARDEAFSFIYEDNLRLFQKLGAEITEFSPLKDKRLPDADGIYLCGGYPELYAGELGENRAFIASLRERLTGGCPSIAECGGFMYLHETLTDGEGRTFPMAGALAGGVSFQGRLVRFGYVELSGRGFTLRGHEFHYYDGTNNGSDCTAAKPVTGKTYVCVHADGTKWWGFPHLYFYSAPEFASAFLRRALRYREERNKG